ncbi:MAG: sodium/proline symporter [Candidatus Babeliales bacterium]
MNIFIIAAFILYVTTLMSIGLHFYSQTKNASDFIVGDRSVNYWVTAIATQASDMGSWLFLGFPAAVYTYGVFECWTAIGLVFFMFLNWQFVAPRLRQRTGNLKSLTLSSYFEEHFHDTTGGIRIISALLILIFFTFYIASGLVGIGRLFELAFAINYHTGILIGLSIGLLYTLIGGFIAVAWCDFFQGLFLLIMIVLVPACAFFTITGIPAIMQAAQEKHISTSLLSSPGEMIQALLLACGWGLGYFGQPHILINFMGIKNQDHIPYAKYVGISWQILVLSASACAGLIALAFFPEGLINEELLFVKMAQELFHPFMIGLLICAILAATLSTMDSHILVSGATLAQDIYKKLFNQHASSKRILLLSRIGSLFICLIALFISWDGNSSIYTLVNYAWSGMGSAFGPVVIVSLYGKNITRQGALAGFVAGGLVAALWPATTTNILPLIPGFSVGIITIYLVSYFTKK